MRASFVVKWHTRRIDNLLQFLRFLNLWHKDTIQECEAILVCHDRCSDIETGFGKTRCLNLNLPEMILSKQTNVGVEQASCEKLIVLDCDRLLPAGYFHEVIEQMHPKEMISTTNVVKLTNPSTDTEIVLGAYKFFNEARTISDPGTRCIWSGNVAFHKSDYYAAGAMDEFYVGYGWEDTDMALRMLKIRVQPIMRSDLEIHLYHEGTTYGSQNQKSLFIKNGIKFCRRWNIKPYPQILAKELSMI